LNDRSDALETHSGIDVTVREWDIFGATGVSDPGYRLRIELDENQIPNLDATRIVFVHERAAGVAIRGKIDMQLRARAARAGVAHHPKVVGLVAVDDVDRGIEIGFAK
jgi:hypothetical protein